MGLFPLETRFPAMGFPKLCPIDSGSISSTPSIMDFKPTLAVRLGTLEETVSSTVCGKYMDRFAFWKDDVPSRTYSWRADDVASIRPFHQRNSSSEGPKEKNSEEWVGM